MSWFSEIMNHVDKRELKYMHRFYYWVKKNHPEVIEEWTEEEKKWVEKMTQKKK